MLVTATRHFHAAEGEKKDLNYVAASGTEGAGSHMSMLRLGILGMLLEGSNCQLIHGEAGTHMDAGTIHSIAYRGISNRVKIPENTHLKQSSPKQTAIAPVVLQRIGAPASKAA